MKKNAIKVIKSIAAVLGFLALFLAVIEPVSRIMTPKTEVGRDNNYRKIAFAYRAEKPDTIDVFAVGNSDAYRCFVPNILYNDYGYTSCVSGMGRQTAKGVYSILKEVLKKQSPEVVLLETDFLWNTKNEQILKTLSTSGKKESKFKIIFTKGAKNFDDIAISSMSYLFPVFDYHTRWKELKKSDFSMKQVYNSELKGYVLSNKVDSYPYGFEYMDDPKSADGTLSTENKTTLDKILSLCKDNKCKVVFFTAPSAQSWSRKKHNTIQAIADKEKTDYLDMNIEGTVPDFSWKTDTQDAGDHMNLSGARKITAVIGKYLNENFNLPDRRSDMDFAEWNEDYKVFTELAKHSNEAF